MIERLTDPSFHAKKLKEASAWAIEQIINTEHCETLRKEGGNAKHLDLLEAGGWVQIEFAPLLMYPGYGEKMMDVQSMTAKDTITLTDAATAVVMQILFAMNSVHLLSDLTMCFNKKCGFAANAKVFFPLAVDLMVSEEKREYLASAFVYTVGQRFAAEVQGPMRMQLYADMVPEEKVH